MAEDAGIEITKEPDPEKLSRRQFLGRVLTKLPLAIAVTAGALNKVAGRQSPAGSKQPSQIVFEKATVDPSAVGQEVQAVAEKKQSDSPLFERVFHDLTELQREEAKKQVAAMKTFLSGRAEYAQLVAVTRRWQDLIRTESQRRGILAQAGLGIILIENSGGTDKVSEPGARGIAQLMPDTARDYGLRVDYGWKAGGIDERADPVKSIKIMAMYLRDNKAILGANEGLAIWSYHAGIGTVMEALRTYFINNRGIDIDSYSRAVDVRSDRLMRQIQAQAAKLIGEEKVNVHKVLADRAVKEMIASLLGNVIERDETELYVYKAVAAAELFDEE